jgi:glycosyltransferase involved in cell wall biosynthesis
VAMSRTRVAHCVSSFEVGGIQSVVEALARAQVREGMDVVVCALLRAPGAYRCPEDDGVRYVDFGISGFRVVTGIRAVARFLRNEHIEVLHAHPGTITRLAGITAKVPIIVATLHGTWPNNNAATRSLHRFLATRTTKFVANSNFTRGYYTALLGLAEGQCVTIHNGIAISESELGTSPRLVHRARFGLSGDAKVAAYVGRLHHEKGADVLLRASKGLFATVSGFELIIAGDGPHRRELEAQVRAAGLERRIHFLGALSDVRPVLGAADVLVAPSRREGFGLAVVEAMALGLPVVATKVGGIPEIVDENLTGLLVEPCDHEALAQAIERILTDVDLASRLGARGAQRARDEFCQKNMVDAYMRLYASLLASSRR